MSLGLVTAFTETEKEMVAVERTSYYSALDVEKPSGYVPPFDWPSRGQVEFKNVSLWYGSKDSAPALSQVSFSVAPGESIGIIGRTGAGKSSLFSVLFRLIESSQGQILIDGIDCRTLDLATLRAQLAIIPQEAVLFSGSIRTNLDPFENHSEEVVWDALRRCGLKSYVEGLPGQLSHVVEEHGSNISIGQRQVL